MGLAVMSAPVVEAFRKVGTEASKQKAVVNAASQWTMVIDLRKCEGCVTVNQPPQCTQSCMSMHFTPEGQQKNRKQNK